MSYSHSPRPGDSEKPQSAGGRQRNINSCLTCRRRKVKCDHKHPVCTACARGSHVCTYASETVLGPVDPGRVAKPGLSERGTDRDLRARVERMERVLDQFKFASGRAVSSRQLHQHHGRPASEPHSPFSSSNGSHGAGMSSDNHDGTLLLGEGQSQFVSSTHYALLAEELEDIKGLLGDKNFDEDRQAPTRKNLVHLLSLGRAKIGVTLQHLLPQSQQQRDEYLELYFSNVDPMVRITHRPTLSRKFGHYIQEAHPIAWAVFYSVINSIPPPVCLEKFGERKDDLLARYELGVEISLARENYLTTSSLEVLQGFLLWLTCITKEDEMGKAWALLGITIRIALNQGLHRDPSLFPHGSMDAITTEVRRRLWCQICHLEYRAAEFKGQEPSITDDDFTTLLPRNIEDDELVEGASPAPNPYDEERFTGMTFQLVRFLGMRALRRIVQSTYRLERRILGSSIHGRSGQTGPELVQELQNIYGQIKTMVNDMHQTNERLASLMEWRCYLLFWLRMPRAYRDAVFSDDIRKSIFEKSVKCVETLNGATADINVARWQWHIGGHSAFQSIMHILSELRNPLFDAPDRHRAIRALRMSRILKENNTSKAWTVVKDMIDKAVAEELTPQPNMTGISSHAYSPSVAPPRNTPSGDRVMPIYSDRLPPNPFQNVPVPYGVSTAQTIPQPQALQPPEPQYNWGDVNLNNIMGDIPQQDPEFPPEFDWGFWGDPVSFNDVTNVPFPLSMDPYAPPYGT